MNTFNKFVKISSLAVLVLVVASCKSKQSATDKDADANAAAAAVAPKIDNTPLSFDAAGSDSGKIDGLETVHFEFDKAALKEEEKRKIQGNASWMKSHANINVQIEGHCDAKGSIEYNLALGERRAKSAREYMTSLGVEGSRLSIISYGKEKPLATGDSDEAYAKNRRANFVPLAQ